MVMKSSSRLLRRRSPNSPFRGAPCCRPPITLPSHISIRPSDVRLSLGAISADHQQ